MIEKLYLEFIPNCMNLCIANADNYIALLCIFIEYVKRLI